MFERFTQAARHVVVCAQDEARLLRHDWIGTEHVLIALAKDTGIAGEVLRAAGVTSERLRAQLRGTQEPDDGGFDAAALRSIGIDLDDVRRSVEDVFGEGALDETASTFAGPRARGRAGHIRFTKRAKKSLERSLRQARMLGHGYLGTEHLLLGVLDEGGGLGVRLLGDMGVDLQALRASALERFKRSA